MADRIYPMFALARATGASSEDLSSAGVNVQAVFIDTALYTFSEAHEFLSDIPIGARIATSGNLPSKTVTRVAGVIQCDCGDFDIVIPAAILTIEAMAFIISTGVAGTSRLVRFTDTAPTLPITPNVAGETRQIRPDPTGWCRWTT